MHEERDSMTALREAAQQALEALEAMNPYPASREDQRAGALAALRAALAQQDEPVAWSGYDLDGMVEAFSRVIEAHHSSKHPFHNPIDMDAKMALRILRGFIPAMKAYAAPPPPQRLPLTDEEIDKIFKHLCNTVGASYKTMTRAIERAHGIGEQP
jgi:hypothetical protein